MAVLTIRDQNRNPFYFIKENTFGTGRFSLEMSTDQVTWTNITDSSGTFQIQNGILYLRGSANTLIGSRFLFTSNISDPSANNAKIVIEGKLAALFDYATAENDDYSPTLSNFAFWYLFATQYSDKYNTNSIVDISNLIFPKVSTAPENSYDHMFAGQTQFKTLYGGSESSETTLCNILPATTLGKECYRSMFEGCSSLISIPDLPALTVPDNAYEKMFTNTSIKVIPRLPATSVAKQSYYQMFKGCQQLGGNALFHTQQLPATQLGVESYREMFCDCTQLKSAPNLLIDRMNEYSCASMFQNTGLITMPIIENNNTLLAYRCCEKMFANCSSLTTATNLPAAGFYAGPTQSQASYHYNQMFLNCNKLQNVPNFGTPSTLQGYGYYRMFEGCTSLTDVTSFPTSRNATVGTYTCAKMFYGCTNISMISATNFITVYKMYNGSSFEDIFNGCTNLLITNTEPRQYLRRFFLQFDEPYSLIQCDRAFANTGGKYTGSLTSGNAYYIYVPTPPSDYHLYVGVNGKAKKVEKIYVGVNGKAKEVTAMYVGVNGKAKQV